MVTTSARLFSILNSLLAEPTMSDIVSLKLCNSIANRFSKVNVSGFMSKFFPVSSINFCQCLRWKRSVVDSWTFFVLNTISLFDSEGSLGTTLMLYVVVITRVHDNHNT